MNMMGATRHSYTCAGVLGAAICAVLLPLRSIAADAPDLQGTWKIIAPQVAFKPEGGSIPFTADGRKQYEENRQHLAAHDYEDYDLATARCASPGTSRLMLTPDRFRIWQRPGMVEFEFEWNRLLRQVDMGGLIPQSRVSSDFLGENLLGRAVPISKGHWEGDTLVVTTEGFDETTLIDK